MNLHRSLDKFPLLRVILLITIILSHTCLMTARQYQTGGPLPAEAVMLTADRSIYLAGDRIYFSGVILEADNFTVSELSKVIRVELLNSSGVSVLSDKFLTRKGACNGSLKLQGDIPTGWYQLRAYSAWMRNMGPELFSRIDIRIINPADASSLNRYVLNDTLKVSVISRNGTALTGVPNRCAIRAVTMKGQPVAVNGFLVNEYGDTLTSFSTGYTGWGVLTWTPEAETDYWIAVDSDPGMALITEMPGHSGAIIDVSINHPVADGQWSSAAREITVTVSGRFPASGVKLLVHRLSTWYLFSEAVPRNGTITFSVPGQDLPDGLLSFTILDKENNTLGSALSIIDRQLGQTATVTTRAESGTGNTEITTSYNIRNPGNPGSYTLTTRRREPDEVMGSYMPALPGWPVTWDIPLDPTEREGWLIASSYREDIASAFFNEEDSEPRLTLISFSDLSDNRESRVNFIPETRGFTLNGRVTLNDGSPVGDRSLSLTGLNDNLFITTRTFDSGRFHFTLPGREGAKDMLLSYTIRPEARMDIEIEPEFDGRSYDLPPAKLFLSADEREFVSQMIVDKKINSLYKNGDLSPALPGENRSTGKTVFYGIPDQIILIDDFIRLPDMREVIFEVVPTVSVKKEGALFSMRVFRETPFPKMYDPLILLDGIPLIRFNEFLELPPDRFSRVDVVNSLYIHGNQVFAGVVNFISVNGDLAGLDLPEGSRIISTVMPTVPVRGEMVNEIATVGDIPVLEPTISFQQLTEDMSGTITCNRNRFFGDYISILNGIDQNGRWVNASSLFSVEKSDFSMNLTEKNR
ncbi:MAG: hypothetical protein LC649_01120 [Bacteroidales bacterium]|nr:hypothetical protein [Bacteroidales bacterium]